MPDAQATRTDGSDIADLFTARAAAEDRPPRLRAVQQKTGALHEISVDELVKLDPQGGVDGDWANALLITLMISDGLTRAQATRRLLDGDLRTGAARRQQVARIDRTIENMVHRGVLVERDERLCMNIDLR